jgi:hypothetical protein
MTSVYLFLMLHNMLKDISNDQWRWNKSKFIYSPTDALVSCLKNNIKIYITIYIKTAPTCFGAVTLSSGIALFVLTEVAVVK